MSLAHAQNILAGTISSVMQRTMEQRRGYTETHADMRIRDGVAQGTVELDGSGESIIEIAFPLKFAEMPIFASGLELRGNTSLEWGHFPVWSATVGYWHTETISGSVVYAGAAVGVVTFNAARAHLHYSFSGRSYAAPVNASTSVNQTL